MLQSQSLLRTPTVGLTRVDHPAGALHHDPAEEFSRSYSITFVESSCFELRVGKRGWRLDPGTLFLTHPWLVYRCRHAEEMPRDVCLSVEFAEEYVEDVCRTVNARPKQKSPVLPLNNRQAYLRLRLLDQAAGSGDALGTDTLAGELLAATVRQDGERPRPLYRESQLAWYARRVDKVRERLEVEYAEPHSLTALGQEAGISPFHFARVFRELTGTPPHRYLLRVRLERAAEWLRAGACVTETCFASGFSNLSHFIRTFRRAFGLSPSRFVS